MRRTKIVATGRAVPERVITNDDLSQWMETSDEWIRQRTGIEERRWVEDGAGVTGSDLALEATHKALKKAGLEVGDIDAIVYATLSPEAVFPGGGCFLQEKLGIPGVPAIDIRTQCSGFLYGLSVADAWIRTGLYDRVLLVGAEIHSNGIDRSTAGRDVAVLFGDGAAVALLEATEAPGEGLLSINLGADGRYTRDLWVEYPNFAHQPFFDPTVMETGGQFPKMNGQKVFKNAVVQMPRSLKKALEDAGHTPEEIDLLVPHQANLRISEAVQRSLKLRDDQVFNNIQRYGNTTAATIPLALDEAIEQGRLKRGDLLALTAFGAGFTWGSAIVRF